MTTLRPIIRPAIAFQPEARAHFHTGMARVTDMLAATLGPMSGHVLSFSDTSKKVEAIDDAATTLRRIISLGRPELDVGAMLVRNVIWQLEQRVGDGGATAAVLLRALVDAGFRQVTAGASPMRLVQGMRRGGEIAVAALRGQARPVHGERALARVARTIMDDDDLAAVLGELSYLLGADGHLQVEMYVAPYLHRVYIGGAHFGARIASMYFYTETQRQRAVVPSPAVALVDEPLADAQQALALLEAAAAGGHKALLIIAPETRGAALSLLVSNHTRPADKRKLAVLAVSLSATGDAVRTARQDLALLTGATLLGKQGMRQITSVRPDDLGKATRAEFVNNSLLLTIDSARRAAVQDEVTLLRRRLDSLSPEDEEREALTQRLAGLSGGIGMLKIGAYHQTARDMRRAQAERAWKVLKAVQRDGVVPGGGAALLHCTAAVREAAAAESEADLALGMRVVADALAVLVERVLEQGSPAAYDARLGVVVDAYDHGLLDAAEVVTEVLQAAVSGAAMILSTDAIVYHKKPQQSFKP
ncbi:MAG: hypothetical protein H3C34_12280 [Caldilineaceae bacterium]|nr:hypothetical protein [Caldilineaceae bacterium]